MKKTDLPQPIQLFKLIHEDAVLSILQTGLSAGTNLHTKPQKGKWPLKHVGAVIHLGNSGTWASKVNKEVWITRGHVGPDYLSLYKQE